VGDVDSNIRRAEAILAEGSPTDIDLLMLPEMAFSGMSTTEYDIINPELPGVCGQPNIDPWN
jgi:protein N-terminal amidase